MTSKKQSRTINFFREFDRFISDSKKGRRLQPNGSRLSSGTIVTYVYSLKLVREFCERSGFALRILPVRRLRAREMIVEKNYWKKFYQQFTNYLYDIRGYFDNYVGQNIKILKTFFNYLNKERVLGVGDFHRQFYVRKEEIPIFPLMPEELNFLIHDAGFEKTLDKRMQEVKDFFVFGCTVALRFSDLVSLKRSNIREMNGSLYLLVRSKKTNTDSLVKLPAYAGSILARYTRNKKKLLPSFNISNINIYIKKLLEMAGFTQPVRLTRNKRGQTIELYKNGRQTLSYRFCDVASSHTMRRTAITTMLSLGVPEQIVRKISGHAAHSKEFHRYVFWSQTTQDAATEQMFEKLRQKKPATAFQPAFSLHLAPSGSLAGSTGG